MLSATDSEDGQSPVQRLRAELQLERRRANLTQLDVAQAMDCSASKIRRIEAGTVRISRSDLHALLHHYGVTDEERFAELAMLAVRSKGQTR